MAGKAHFWTYVKAAFRDRWNVLFLGASLAATVILGRADVLLPLIGAAELVFVTAVSSSARFQRSVDARTGAVEAAQSAETMLRRFNQLFYALSSEAQEQFNQIRARCEVLRPAGQGDAAPAETSMDAFATSQMTGVNRLLWVYLKLLHTRATLDRFLQSTDEDEIVNLEQTTRLRLEALPKDSADEITAKKRRSLEDTLATATARRDNLKRAKENHEYVQLELERIAAKLTALAEMAVNRQDPAAITSGVDDVARSVEGTEQAINELQSFTGLTKEDEQAPPILKTPPRRVRA